MKKWRGKHFLSLYGGSGRRADAAGVLGVSSSVVDLCDGVTNDINRREVQAAISADVASGRIGAVGIDLPCVSWSRARRGPPGGSFPCALRGEGRDLYGLPSLSLPDQQKVKSGNIQYRHAVKLISKCVSSGIRGYLENPRTSRLWLTRGMRKLVK